MSVAVTVDDLVSYMSDITLTEEQKTAAQFVLDGVESDLAAHLNRPLQVVTITNEPCVPDPDDGTFRPKVTPVHTITGASDGQGGDLLSSITRHPASPRNLLVSSGSPNLLLLTYTAGLDGKNEPGLRQFVLRVASREMLPKHDDARTTKDLLVEDDEKPSASVIGPTAGDFARVKRYRKRTAVTWTTPLAGGIVGGLGLALDLPEITVEPEDPYVLSRLGLL